MRVTNEQPGPTAEFDFQVSTIAALGEPIRRTLYRYVIAQPEPVNRDQAAAGVGVARHVAKFHLDKLVEDGLLDVEYARPPGRGGPGAGRPAKRYRRSGRELTVSLPPRAYEFAGRILAHAVTTSQRDQIPVAMALRDTAQEVGYSMGRRARQQAHLTAGASQPVGAATGVLSDYGYEPRVESSGVVMVNCPFHALARDYRDLVCDMNLQLMTGFVDGLEDSGLQARLEPSPQRCCVRLAQRNPAGSASSASPPRSRPSPQGNST
jgi:predicted ArsR family transcriptional regulator